MLCLTEGLERGDTPLASSFVAVERHEEMTRKGCAWTMGTTTRYYEL
jgi:hypothetical protein